MCYTGVEDLSKELPADLDVLFVSAFTRSAHIAYALSQMCRAQGHGSNFGVRIDDYLSLIEEGSPKGEVVFCGGEQSVTVVCEEFEAVGRGGSAK